MPAGRKTGTILKKGRPSKLRAARIQAGLSMQEVADLSGYAYGSIGAWECGSARVSPEVREAYSKITGVPIEQLQTRDQRRKEIT